MRNPFDTRDASARQVAAEQMRAHYAQLPAMCIAPSLGGLFTAWVLWDAVDNRVLVVGMALVLLLSGLRLLLYRQFLGVPEECHGEQRWRVLAVLGALLSGCIWGSAAPLLYAQAAGTPYLVYLLVLLVLLPIVPVAALAVYMPAFYAYLVPCAAPFVVTLALQPGRAERMAALLVPMMCLAMSTFARRHSASLDESVRLRTQLARRTEELQAAVRAKSQFIAAASHDLRQPVQAMGLFLDALRDDGGDAAGNGLVKHLDASLGNLRNMLNNMLDVSRLDAEVVRPRSEVLAVDNLFDRLLAEYRPLAQQAGLVLRLRGVRGVHLLGDAALLERMLRNLLANALKYTPTGGVTLVCRPRAGVVRLQVFDSGTGIAVQHQDHVFDAFVRLPGHARADADGLGLGLSITRRFAALQGQRLRLCSRPGRGSVFSIDTSAAGPEGSAQAASPAVPLPAPGPQPMRKLKVLIVDDEPNVAQATRAALIRWGHAAVAAAGEVDALAAWPPGVAAFDLLIVDFGLAGGASGLDLAARLQGLCPRPLPVIVVTGEPDPRRLAEAQLAGHLLLHKPVDPQALRAAIHAACPDPSPSTPSIAPVAPVAG